MNATTRPMLAAVLAAAALAIVPAAAPAADGDAQPMSSAETYALTCGHLGVPCNPPRSGHRHRARNARHARGARHRHR